VDIFSMQFLWALGAIILIDLVLAGDNAIVIALAARNLPKHLQKKAVMWGTVGAIVVRSAMTLVVVWLLKIPGLLLVGGALLLWIAVKLLKPADHGAEGGHTGTNTFWGAMKTIIIADAVMGLDNVLAVAGAAHGNFLLVVLGLLISIPIVVWGSTLILKWVEKYPAIMYIGAAVLALTAAKMMLSEPLVKPYVEPYMGFAWFAYIAIVGAVLAVGYSFNRKGNRSNAMNNLAIEATAGSAAAPLAREQSLVIPGRILLPVNGGAESRGAAEYLARSLRDASGAQVHLLHVTPFIHKHIGRFLPRQAKQGFAAERATRSLEPVQRLLELAGVKTTVHASTSLDIAAEVLAVAEREQCARIVMGATRKSTLVRTLTNSVTGRVLAGSTIPVEIVTGGPASLWQRIGVPAGVGLAVAALLIELD